MRAFLALLFSFLFVSSSFAGVIKDSWKFPSDIFVYKNEIYVVDGLNNRVIVYNSKGERSKVITLPSPYGIFVDGSGVFVTSQKGFLYLVTSKGIKTLKIVGRPIDVVVVKGKVYVTDGKTQTVDVYDLKGNLIKRFGGKGYAPGKFEGIFSISTDGKLLYVVDSVNGRIQEFDLDGNFVRYFGRFGIERGELFRPKGIAVSKKYGVFVSDCITGAVQRFNGYGGFLGIVAKKLNYPIAVSISDNKLFVLEPLRKEVSEFTVQGVK